jgi:hypothetical protein
MSTEQSEFGRRGRRAKKGWEQNKNNGRRHKSRECQRAQGNTHTASAQGRVNQMRERPAPRVNKEIVDNIKHSMAENDKAIREFRLNKIVCARCGSPIDNIAESLCDKRTGDPVHFDCVVSLLGEQEKISPSERIIYIGKGRFAVAFYANQHDDKNFSIRRIIEWEEPLGNTNIAWRQEISGLFSQVK